jgi:phosphoglycerate kinase
MNLKSVEEIRQNIRVVMRMDLDVPEDDNSRLLKSVPTIRYLIEKGCQLAIIGHKGRPKGRDEKYSLRPVYLELMSILGDIDSIFLDNFETIENKQLLFFENLRFWDGEETNDKSFMKNLIDVSDAYVNDAFAVAHRTHASIMLHQELDAYYGFSFLEEAEKISKLLESPERPLTIVLGGAKEDKLSYLPELANIADKILIGGKLPKMINFANEKVIVGKLSESGLDLSKETIEQFTELISSSKTLVWAGSMGFYEDENSREGTEAIAKAIADTSGYKIIAGGDTSASIKNLGLKEKIDFVCSGGGVLLEFLTKKTLPAWTN